VLSCCIPLPWGKNPFAVKIINNNKITDEELVIK
jgi:hypothetical protein